MSFKKREVLNVTARSGDIIAEEAVKEVLEDARAEKIICHIEAIVKKPIVTVSTQKNDCKTI